MSEKTKLIHAIDLSALTDPDRDKLNKYRFERLHYANGQSHAYVILSVGLYYDHKNQTAIPVICGQEWANREITIQLLKEALFVLDNPIIDDQLNKVKELGK